MQVERDDDRQVFAEQPAQGLEQRAFRIDLALGAHRAMQGNIESVDRPDVRRRGGEQFLAQPQPVAARQYASAAGAGRHGGNHRDVGACVEHRQRTANRRVEAALRQQRLAMVYGEILITRGERIEGGDLLHALHDQDAHRSIPALQPAASLSS